jgi:hypothetical protein
MGATDQLPSPARVCGRNDQPLFDRKAQGSRDLTSSSSSSLTPLSITAARQSSGSSVQASATSWPY